MELKNSGCGEAFHIANIPDTPMQNGDYVDYVDLLDSKKGIRQLRREINALDLKTQETMRACHCCVGSFKHKDMNAERERNRSPDSFLFV